MPDHDHVHEHDTDPDPAHVHDPDREYDHEHDRDASQLANANPPATGPNVDTGLVAGDVTVDPETAQGAAAAAARDANTSEETQHDDGTIEVTHGAHVEDDERAAREAEEEAARVKAAERAEPESREFRPES